MSLTHKDIELFETIVKELIAKHEKDGETDLTAFLAELYLYAQNSSARFLPTRTSIEHRTGTSNSQIDFNMVMFSIIAASWAARTRGLQSDKGQCWAHHKGCKEMQDFHRQVYLDWVAALEELIAVLKAGTPPAAKR